MRDAYRILPTKEYDHKDQDIKKTGTIEAMITVFKCEYYLIK